MNFVPHTYVPHPSHEMSEWISTILAPAGTERFYDTRHCKHCGAEEAKGNAHLADESLSTECVK